MVHIVPSLSLIKKFRYLLQSGKSASLSLKLAIEDENTEFSRKINLWFMQYRAEGCSEIAFKPHGQKFFVEILSRALDGAPVLQILDQLENEMEQEFERQWKAWLESLPYKLSIPLLLFFFPAYGVLLFGPLLTQFLYEVK